MSKYINPRDNITSRKSEIDAQKQKLNTLFSVFEGDSITFPQWLEMLTAYIEKLQAATKEAQNELAEFKKDEEIQYWKDLYENARLSQKYGFPISEEEHNSILQWQRTHDAEVHGLRTAHERIQAGGAIGGRYFYRFYPTSIGVCGECVCGRCHILAASEAAGDNNEYRKEMEKLGGSYEFQELG